MAETTSNVELAVQVGEQGHHHRGGDHKEKWLGFAEAALLAVVALATAWSGYQSARWEAASAKDYALHSHYTVLAQERTTLAGQDRLYDIVTFNGWTEANDAGNKALAALFERRFRHEYRTAFAAWVRLDPVHNKTAPAGPIFMSEYKNANEDESRRLATTAAERFEGGLTASERADDYVRVTVLLATVLLLTALSQRFELTGPRTAVIGVGGVLLVISTFLIVTLPRL
jgi:hypothetical protein